MDELGWLFLFDGQGIGILTTGCRFVTKCNGPLDPNTALRQSMEMRRETLSGHTLNSCLVKQSILSLYFVWGSILLYDAKTSHARKYFQLIHLE